MDSVMWNSRKQKHGKVNEMIKRRNECLEEWRRHGRHVVAALYGEHIFKMAAKVVYADGIIYA